MTNPFRTDLIAILIRRGHKGKEIVEMVREIEALLAPVLADAEKWRVLEKKYPNFCKRFDVTIDALEGEGEKG